MQAKLFVKFEPGIYIPNEVEFPIREYEQDGYLIRELIPAFNKVSPSPGHQPEFVINKHPASLCNLFRLEFHKDSFDRSNGNFVDPPPALIRSCLSSLVSRLRFLLKAGMLRVPDFPICSWNLRYLNDDGTELPPQDGLCRERAGGLVPISWIALSPDHWKEIIALPPEFEPRPWETLLLDATVLFPHIGPAIALAATALEVLISTVLDELAKHKGLSPSLWEWLNNRNDRSSNPGLEEQYDGLLKEFSGHSLKEDGELWETFKNLKAARNSFVHEGVAKLGKKPMTWDEAIRLVNKASRIPSKVREWLPDTLKWPIYDIRLDVAISQRLL